MPRYYTHLYNDVGDQHDDTGREFASEDEAFEEAAKTAAGVLADEMGSLRSRFTLRLEVERADGSPAGTVEVVARMDRAP